jgi:hypothetical protein
LAFLGNSTYTSMNTGKKYNKKRMLLKTIVFVNRLQFTKTKAIIGSFQFH